MIYYLYKYSFIYKYIYIFVVTKINIMIISIINHKGGTGKTTSAINISAYLSALNYKVLLVDLDSQSNSTQGLMSTNDYTLFDAVKSNEIDVNRFFKYNDNLSVFPSSNNMIGLDKELGDKMIGRERVFDNLFKPIKQSYDFIILDNPPLLSHIALNSLITSDFVLVPLEAEYYSQKGLDNLILFFNDVKNAYKNDTQILGVFLTKFVPNTRLSNYFNEEFTENYKDLFLSSKIRKNVKLGEAQLDGLTILDYDNSSNGAIDYKNLTDEILTKIKN